MGPLLKMKADVPEGEVGGWQIQRHHLAPVGTGGGIVERQTGLLYVIGGD